MTEDENIIPFPSDATTLDLDPEVVILGAKEAQLQQCVIIGICSDGEFYLASSDANMAEVNLLIDRAKKRLLEHEDSLADEFEDEC